MGPQPSDQKKRKPISLTSKAPPPHTLAASPGNLWHHHVLSLLLSLLFRMGEPASSINPSNKLHQNLVWNVAYLPLAFELCRFIKVVSAMMEPCIRWVTEACEHPGVKLGPEVTHTCGKSPSVETSCHDYGVPTCVSSPCELPDETGSSRSMKRRKHCVYAIIHFS